MIKKPSFEKYLSTFTPFYINNEFDLEILKSIDLEVEKYKSLLHVLKDFEGIESFITDHPEGLKIVLSLIDLSVERFKRIVSTIRIKRGDIVSSEWGLDRVRRELILNTNFKNKIINLFLFGSESEIGEILPSYYVENINLSEGVIEKLSDEFYLKRILKRVGDGSYNNSVGDRVEDLIAAELDQLNRKFGITYSREKYVSFIKRNMDFCIPNETDPYVIIESSFQVTTGSGQTTKREVEVETSTAIRSHNIQNGKSIAFVNLCDGAGWLGRQADLKKIYHCSDYVLTLNTLNILEEIINEHVPKKYITKTE